MSQMMFLSQILDDASASFLACYHGVCLSCLLIKIWQSQGLKLDDTEEEAKKKVEVKAKFEGLCKVMKVGT